MKEIKHIEEFKEVIMQRAVVMISKKNCPYCEKAKPWLEEISAKSPDAHIYYVDKDNIASVLEVFQVKMYPTFVAFHQGKVIDMFFGDTQEELVTRFVEQNI